MNQAELNRAVARATGESVATISRRGFVPLTQGPVERDPEGQTVDWDELEAQQGLVTVQDGDRAAVPS